MNQINKQRQRGYLSYVIYVVLLFLGVSQVSQAQKMKMVKGEPIVCRLSKDHEDHNHNLKIRNISNEQLGAGKTKFNIKSEPTSEMIITYGVSAQSIPEVQEAFQFAIDIWSREIVSDVPIRIFADFTGLGAGVLAVASPTAMVSNFPGAPQPNVLYPIALANTIAGEDLSSEEEFDMRITLGNSFPFYFGTDGNTPEGMVDFVTVVLHEMAHGLGFTGSVGLNSRNAEPNIYDTFVVNGNQEPLTSLEIGSTELSEAVSSNDVFINSPLAVKALGGQLPQLFAPENFLPGSSISHWDEDVFDDGNANSLLTPVRGRSNFNVGNITRGLFEDMGWQLVNKTNAIFTTPINFSVELSVGEVITKDIDVSNIMLADVVVNSSINPKAKITSAITPSKLNIAFSKRGNLTVTFDATNIPAGIYNETILLETDGFDTIKIPVTLRVLDGTEVSILNSNRTTFNEFITESNSVTRNLVVSNPGNGDLDYNLSLNNSSSTFVDENKKTILSFDFEDFQIGNIEGQQNWAVLEEGESSPFLDNFDFFGPSVSEEVNPVIALSPDTNFNISKDDSLDSNKHLEIRSNGSGESRTAESSFAFSNFSSFTSVSVRLKIEGNDSSFTLQSRSVSLLRPNAIMRFNIDGSIDLFNDRLDSFIKIADKRPEGYFTVRLVTAAANSDTLRVYINDELVSSGGILSASTPIAEQFVFSVGNEGNQTKIEIDDIVIEESEIAPFFLTPTPLSRVIPFTESLDVELLFDAKNLESGIYNTNATITSNNAANLSSLDIPIRLTVLPKGTVFALINSETNTVIQPLKNGDVVDLANLETNQLSVIALDNTSVGSFVFDYNGNSGVQTESVAPYAIGGDVQGNFKAFNFELGENTITAIPFSEVNAGGIAGDPLTVTFEIIDSNAPEIVEFLLVNAYNNKIVQTLKTGDILDLGKINANNLNVVAKVGEVAADSVVFDYNGIEGFRIENYAPFAIASDRRGRLNAFAFDFGQNTITATPFTEVKGKAQKGQSLTITFEVIDSTVPEITGFVLVNSKTNKTIGALQSGDVIDFKSIGTNAVNVVAITGDVLAKSVVFDYNGIDNIRTENFAPYAIGGDNNGNFGVFDFNFGQNTITATPFSKSRGIGKAGRPLTITFRVKGEATSEKAISSNLSRVIYPNPVQDLAQLFIENSGNTTLRVVVFDIQHVKQAISSFKVSLDENGRGQLDVSNLKQGNYILFLFDNKNKVVSKIKMLKK